MLLMLTTAIILSCQSEEDRKNEEQREELRSMIEEIEKNQRDYIEAQREYDELHEKHQFKKSVLAKKTPLEVEREKLASMEKAYGEGWQAVMREKIDEASGEEDLRRVAMELAILDQEAGTGKVLTEGAVRHLKQRMAMPKEQRMP